MEVLVLEIQRMSTEDGPGIRTTAFLKGCPLRCRWCHNPESIPRAPQLQWIGSRCIGCRLCLDACPEAALSAGDQGISIDRDRCRGCGACAQECPTTALELLGIPWKVDTLLDELIKDRAYFERSGGGVTLSGGEPTLQTEETEALLGGLRARGIHAALDTCGLCAWETLARLLPQVDLLLYDLKELDPARHREYTGADNGLILENLRRACAMKQGGHGPKALWVRTPLIPGFTADHDTIAKIGGFIAGLPEGAVDRWDLCRFNNLCKDKYTRLGMEWELADCPLLTDEEVEAAAAAARASGVDPAIVRTT